MTVLSKRVSEIAPSATLAIDTRVKELIQNGEDIINLSVGEPDTDTPMKASYMAIEGISKGFTKYTNSSGIIELRKRLSQKFKEDNNLDYDPDQIIVSVGGKHSLYNIFMTLCNPGDEVILPAPFWVSYSEQIKLADAVPVIISTDESTDFKVTPAVLESYITNKTKLLVLNSPSNPTGTAYTKEEIVALAGVLEKHDNVYVISDEIYEKLIYDGEHYSIANVSERMKERTLIVNGFSKTFGMTGWRLGYTAGAKEIIKGIANFQSHVTSNVTSVAQLAAIGALNDYDHTQKEMFRQRLEYVYGRVSQMPYLRCVKPQGAFYVFPNVEQTFGRSYKGTKIESSEDFCRLLLDHHKVGIVSGVAFGSPNNVRISYALNLTRLEEAMNRLDAFLAELE
ncbi:pyridoxal phosphate-dependent aminotransferase [Paenibacillus sp. MMS18-CY102]|uniref:pyridoxal phosphate-dependent aminotransferase n=1 Tax=Paenibacillus sp. MMS18-CY102 TaxID=2682849 RepID=UPI001F427D0B|nr:pyridoxal phosphate-dependent aminotransferase [Paenibacillus sp. MMS18-CY102]